MAQGMPQRVRQRVGAERFRQGCTLPYRLKETRDGGSYDVSMIRTQTMPQRVNRCLQEWYSFSQMSLKDKVLIVRIDVM